jgi:acetolactate synthase-1/2/3 large subunit
MGSLVSRLSDHYTTADLVMDTIDQRLGTRYVFAVPGSHGLPLLDALRRNSRLTGVTARHEQGSAFMADGYARASGRPGVCLTSTGPGLLNSLTGTATAAGDGVPLLNITTCADSTLSDTSAGMVHEAGSQMVCAAEVTTWSATVRSAELAPVVMADAVQQLRRPGAVAVEFPLDVLASDATRIASPDSGTPDAGDSAGDPRGSGAPAGADFRRAAVTIAAGSRPLLWVGRRAADSTASVQLLAETAGSAVFTSVLGKGVLDERHPLALGVFDPVNPTHEALLRTADPLVMVGVDLTHQETRGFRLAMPRRVIRLDGPLPPHSDRYRFDVELRDEPGRLCRELARALEALSGRHTSPASMDAVRQVEAQRRQELAAVPDAESLITGLEELSRRHGILVNDITTAAYWAVAAHSVSRPEQFLYPWRFAPLGYALPAAIGAQLATPDRPVLALCGDGGFAFTGMELGTAVQFDVPVTALVVDNGGYGLVRDRQRARYRHESMTTLRNPDFVALAEAFGIDACRVPAPADLPRLLARALDSGKPSLLHLQLDLPQPTATSGVRGENNSLQDGDDG